MGKVQRAIAWDLLLTHTSLSFSMLYYHSIKHCIFAAVIATLPQFVDGCLDHLAKSIQKSSLMIFPNLDI